MRSNQSSGRGTFRIGVENTIAPLLPHGRAQAEEIAHRLGLSRRTLARRLASEALTFEGVLSGLRADLAKRYLRDETVAISQIAWLVGYKEVSAFTHAAAGSLGERLIQPPAIERRHTDLAAGV